MFVKFKIPIKKVINNNEVKKHYVFKKWLHQW